MKESTRQTIEAISSNPKVSTVITAAVTSNVWFDYGEPVIKAATSVLGLAVLIILVVKHALDIKKEHFTKDK